MHINNNLGVPNFDKCNVIYGRQQLFALSEKYHIYLKRSYYALLQSLDFVLGVY